MTTRRHDRRVLAVSPPDERELVERLRRRDEAAFGALVDTLSPALLRTAMAYVPSRAVAEEVVQETWMAVMRGIDGFQGRASLKTWIFRILTNLARKGNGRERRSLPFSSLIATDDPGGPSVDPDRFLGAEHERYPGHWALAPTPWPTPRRVCSPASSATWSCARSRRCRRLSAS